MLTKEKLFEMISDVESYHVERTVSTDNMDKFCQAICAFANDISGSGKQGYLIIGATDDGKLSGLQVNDRLLLQVANIRTDGNILPQPVMTVEKQSFDQGDVLVVAVTPAEFPPVRYKGRVWVRVGPRKSIASEAEEKILVERRLSNIHTFDTMPCLGTSIDDLDIAIIKREFLPKAVNEDVLVEDRRSTKEQLSSLGFYDLRYDCPTNGAIVLFGKNPERYLHGAYIQYVRFKGYDRAGDIVNEHKFSGPLCRELSKIDVFVETGIAQKRPIPVSVLREETVAKYPYWATRELLMNAIMHRDYESNAPILFYEYDDRIEIQNPGGLYGKVNPENFPNVSDYRNPFIAEAMKVLGYVNRFSRGVYRVQKELKENDNPPARFDLSLMTAFRVIEGISQKYLDKGFHLADMTGEIYRESDKESSESGKELSESDKESSESGKELSESGKESSESGKESSESGKESSESGKESSESGKESSESGKELSESGKELSESGKELSESGKELSESGKESSESGKGATESIRQIILNLMETEQQVTSKELVEMFGISARNARYHLQKLAESGLVERQGQGRATRWVKRKETI